MTRLSGACVGLLLLTFIMPCASAAGPKRVLILDPFGRDVAPFSDVISTFRFTLARELGEPVDIYDLPLDLARFAEPEGEGPLVAFLEGRITRHPVDLVVPIGGAGVQFAARHRERLFPDKPVLVLGPDPRFVPPGFLRTNATLVTQKVNLRGMIEDILQMQPETTHIAVVFGASALERRWVDECRREFQSFTNRVEFTWLNGLSLEQVLERCAALPPRSFILHGLFVVDAGGVPCEQNEALRRLHQIANAPLFGYFDSEFGLGPIGGRLYQGSEVGAQGARTAIRILRGERPGSIPPQVFEAAAPVFDWRELQRWHVSEARLPAGSVVQFRRPAFWELYRWPIAGTVLFCLLQAALIIGLLVNRAKRRQGEAEATLVAGISWKFVHIPPGEVDREIMDAQRGICQFLGLDLAALWQWSDEAPGVLTPTHVYAQEGLQAPGQMRQEHFPWYVQEMLAGRMVAFSSLEELPAEAAVDRETCRQLGVKSNLTIPLSVGGEPPVGVLGLNTLRTKRDWPDALVKRLQLVAQILANALARKRADQALRESEELNRATFEQAAVGIAHVGTDGRWLRVNDKLCAIVGYRPEELMKLTFQDITRPEDLETELNFVRQVLSGEIKSYSMEKRYLRKDRSVVWVLLTVSLVRTAAGTPMYFISVAEDITEQRRAEMEAQELGGNLMHLTRVNTLGTLSGSLAHELNQPLGIILTNAQAAQDLLLQEPPDVAEVQSILSDIVKADRRAGEIIERLRALFKRSQVSLQPLPLNQIIEEVLYLTRADLIGRGVSVVRELAPHLPPIAGDRVQLQQLVLNLILNAADAMAANAPGASRLHLQTMLHQGRVRASVRDEGDGLPGDVERLFQPFYTTKSQGLGMGLAICRTIVAAHNGRLWAETHSERGAVFHFELPAAGSPEKP